MDKVLHDIAYAMRNRQVRVKLTEEERAAISHAAARRGLSMAAWMRTVALNEIEGAHMDRGTTTDD